MREATLLHLVPANTAGTRIFVLYIRLRRPTCAKPERSLHTLDRAIVSKARNLLNSFSFCFPIDDAFTRRFSFLRAWQQEITMYVLSFHWVSTRDIGDRDDDGRMA
jgi:hypothetical protein